MVICSSLLHEVEKPEVLLKAIFSVCNESTIVHINVPNAKSFHRILAYESGMIKNVHDMSKRNIELQQNRVFDIETVAELVRGCGGTMIDSGTYFVKPFTHKQMLDLLEEKIIDEDVLNGFYTMTKYMPDLGSELYVTCKLANEDK